MKKVIIPALALFSAITVAAEGLAPAFPGAEGHGRYVTGGRGGKIVHVTNLNDSGAGSLREAVKGSAKKIVVFDVSGYIDLSSDLLIGANTTIAGQTAPGAGITIRYRTLRTNGNNIIIRFIRGRRSQVTDVNDGADAIWDRHRTGIILDHCSFSWSIDEVASFYDNKDFTMQWCTVAEGLANAGHDKGAHSYGGIWGGKNASFHHNFLAHVQNRIPRFCGARFNWTGYDKAKYANAIQGERVDMRNCVMYNWGNGNGCYGGTGGGHINIVNNYYKAGPGTKNKTRVTQVSFEATNTSYSFGGYCCRYYIDGNYVAAAATPESYDWKGVIYDNGASIIDGERYIPDAQHLYGDDVKYVKNSSGVDCVAIKMESGIEPGEVTTHKATAAFDKVLAYAGASLFRDGTDTRYMEEARTGTTTYTGHISKTKGILDVINDPKLPENTENPTASFPELPTESRPADFDTDKDGMPDAWEIANGLNPNDASDANYYTLCSRGWYTNVEVYINSLVEHIMKGGNEDAIDSVDEYYPAYVQSGISDVTVDSEVLRIEYYNLQGIRLTEPGQGLNIRRIIYSNGKVVTDKVLM